MRIKDYDLLVKVDGTPLEEMLEENSDTTWVAALKGEEFTVYINNNSDRRILAVPLIDGLSVMDGKPGNLQSRGYILGAHAGGVIPGWRIDSETVAAFKFDSASKGLSFFEKKTNRDIGIIQCAIYAEKQYPRVRPKYIKPKPTETQPNHDHVGIMFAARSIGLYGGSHYRDVEPTPSPKKMSPSASGRGLASLFKDSQQEENEKVAVGFGAARTHHTNEVSFSREPGAPICTLSIRYDTQANLAARGNALVSKAAFCDQWFSKGEDAMKAGRFSDAISAFSRVTKVRPEDENGWAKLASACQLSGNAKGLLHAASILARLNYRDASMWNHLGLLYLADEAWKDAVDAFDKYNELAPNDALSWNNLGFALAKAGQTEEAWYCCNKAIEIDPQFSDAWDSLGVTYLIAGRLDEAVQAFSKSVEIDPKNTDAWQNLCTTYNKMSRSKDASVALKHLRKLNPSRAKQIILRS